MLTAGAVTCIVSIANNLDKLYSLEILLGVLVVFYIIGLIAKAIISKVLDSVGVPEEQEDESMETDGLSEESKSSEDDDMSDDEINENEEDS